MSRFIANVTVAGQTFQNWFDKTNQALDIISTDVVTVKANTAGDVTTGNGFISGVFGANTIVGTVLRGGNVTSTTSLTVTSNVALGNTANKIDLTHNGYVHVKSDTYTSTNTDPQIVDTFAAASYRSGKYLISITDNLNTEYQSSEIMVMHNDTTASTTEYATLVSNSTLGVFVANIDSGSVRLYVTPTAANTNIKYQRTLIAV